MARKIECPSCFFEFVAPPGVAISEVIRCPDCDLDLEVVRVLKRHVLAERARVDEDWGE
ncbi:MAG: lysine biosynthesis protein LysW [Promethearchaeota archaeon]